MISPQSPDTRPMYMNDYVEQLDSILTSGNRKLLTGTGSVSHDQAMKKTRNEYPDCGLYAAGHPFDVKKRLEGMEYGWPIKIGNNVWIGGGVKIMGGVSIGDNTVIAAGSIINRSIPANVLAGGNPCRVIREIRPEDDEKYIRGFQGFA